MEKKIAPSEAKAQALRALLQGQTDAQSGEELLSTLVRLSTERVLQEALVVVLFNFGSSPNRVGKNGG
jgi:hypothetical protein